MTCEETQQSLLQGYEPTASAVGHIAVCGACAAYEERLLSLNRAVRGLPAAPGMIEARNRFLATLARTDAGSVAPVHTIHPISAAAPALGVRMRISGSAADMPPARLSTARARWAVAAAVLLAVGGASWGYLALRNTGGTAMVVTNTGPNHGLPLNVNPDRSPSPTGTDSQVARVPRIGVGSEVATPVVPVNSAVGSHPSAAPVAIVNAHHTDLLSQLVSRNVELAEINAPEKRLAAYQGDAALRQKVLAAPLSPTDRTVADTLIGDSVWLSRHDDPLATADRFISVADLLVDRMNAAEGSPDSVSKLGQTYCLVVHRGINKNLDRVGPTGSLNADRQNRLNRMMQNHEKLQRKVETMMQKYPQATRQEILLAIEANRLRNKKHQQSGLPGAGVPAAKP